MGKMKFNKYGIVEAESKEELYNELCQYGTANYTTQHQIWLDELYNQSDSFAYTITGKGESIKLLTP
jgi:hypothetical protein